MSLLNKIQWKYVSYKGKKDYIAFVKCKGGLAKVRAKIIVIKDDKIFCVKASDTERKKTYNVDTPFYFPGGSLEVSTKEETKIDPEKLIYKIADHESKEEMRIICKNWINTGMDDMFTYDPNKDKKAYTGMPIILDENTGEETNELIAGTYSVIFIGVYDRSFNGKIAQRDINTKVKNNGSFIKYQEIYKYITPNERTAIKQYNPELAKLEKANFSYESKNSLITLNNVIGTEGLFGPSKEKLIAHENLKKEIINQSKKINDNFIEKVIKDFPFKNWKAAECSRYINFENYQKTVLELLKKSKVGKPIRIAFPFAEIHYKSLSAFDKYFDDIEKIKLNNKKIVNIVWNNKEMLTSSKDMLNNYFGSYCLFRSNATVLVYITWLIQNKE